MRPERAVLERLHVAALAREPHVDVNEAPDGVDEPAEDDAVPALPVEEVVVYVRRRFHPDMAPVEHAEDVVEAAPGLEGGGGGGALRLRVGPVPIDVAGGELRHDRGREGPHAPHDHGPAEVPPEDLRRPPVRGPRGQLPEGDEGDLVTVSKVQEVVRRVAELLRGPRPQKRSDRLHNGLVGLEGEPEVAPELLLHARDEVVCIFVIIRRVEEDHKVVVDAMPSVRRADWVLLAPGQAMPELPAGATALTQ